MKLATSHQNADLDAMGSLLALRGLHPDVRLALPAGMDPVTRRVWQAQARHLPELLAAANLRKLCESETCEALWVVDTASPARLGYINALAPRFAQVRAYDTHPPAPEDLPRATFTASAGSACTSGLVLMLHRAGKRLSPVHAGMCLLGIHQDTGHFTFASTERADHRAAALCVAWGAPRTWPARYLPKGYTRLQLRVLEAMGRKVRFVAAGLSKVAVIGLELRRFLPNLAELVEELRAAERWPAAILVASVGDRAFVMARARRGRPGLPGFDAAHWMHALGGGGHSEAASAVLHHVTCEQAVGKVLATLTQCLQGSSTAGAIAAQPVLSVPAAMPVHAALNVLHTRAINAAPVLADGATARPLGVVTLQALEAAQRRGYKAQAVRKIALLPARFVAPQASLRQARHVMVEGKGQLLLVGKAPQIDGVLTRGMLLRATTPRPQGSGGKVRLPAAHANWAALRKRLGAMFGTVRQVAAHAEDLRLPLYLVGGSVRDLLQGGSVRDIDLLVEGSAPKLAKAVAAALGGEVKLPQGFQTATWRHAGQPDIDLATARSEFYAAPAALPTVQAACLEDDLFRRDFTINAMAMRLQGPEPGALIDPYGGFADIKAGLLRVLHGQSFVDDPTRAFRAARFAARFDFELAPDTAGLMQAARRSGVFAHVSLERLGWELDLLLDEDDVLRALRLLRTWKLGTCIHKSLTFDHACLRRIVAASRARLRCAALCPQLPRQREVLWLPLAACLRPEVRALVRRLIVHGKAHLQRFLHGPERVAAAQQALGSPKREHWQTALDGLDDVELINLLSRPLKATSRSYVQWWLKDGRHVRSAIDGHMLHKLGHKAGPQFKRALAAALQVARDGGDADAQLHAAVAALS